MSKTRYIIVIGCDEEPLRVEQKRQDGLTVMITARTFEEAERLRQQEPDAP